MPSMFQEFARSIMPINAEVIVVITALVVLIFDFFLEKENKQYLGWFSLFGIIFAAIATYKLMGANGAFFGGTFLLDPFSTFFKFVFYIACGLGHPHIHQLPENRGHPPRRILCPVAVRNELG